MEAYHILLGHVAKAADGRLVAMEDPGMYWGPTDGATKLRTLGVTRVHRFYVSGKNNTQAVFEAGKLFKNMGREVAFLSRDKVYGCQMKTYIFYPVVLAFYENDEKKLQLSAFTARCITARLAAFLAIKRFEKLTKGILVKASIEEKEGKEAAKKEKKADRSERRKEAKERREQKRLEKEALEINSTPRDD